MSVASLTKEVHELNDGFDSIVVIKALTEIPGGRTLDVSGVAAGTDTIRCGHVLVQNKTTKAIKPLAINSGNYETLPSDCEYLGVLKYSVPVSRPFAAILTAGQVNAAASPAPITSAIKTALSRIEWLY